MTPRSRTIRRRIAPLLARHRRLILIACVSILIIIVVAQLTYPRDRALPLTRINGQVVGWAKHDTLVARLQMYFEKSTVTMKVGAKTFNASLSSLGAVPDTSKMSSQLTDYPIWQRLLPLSFLFHQDDLTSLDVYFDEVQLQKQAVIASEQLTQPPTDARLAIQNGAIVATDPQMGWRVDRQLVSVTLSASRFLIDSGTTINLAAPTVAPSRTLQDIAPVRQRAAAALARQITVELPDGSQLVPDEAIKASWLRITGKADGSLALEVDDTKINDYVTQLNDKVRIPAGITYVKLLDGRETGRTDGSDGSALIIGELTAQLKSAMSANVSAAAVRARTVSVSPAVQYQTSYTSTTAGLQAYLDALARTRDIHIAVTQLDGQGMSASVGAGDSIPSASTYKLYVSLMLFDKIDHGQLQWSDAMLDTDVAGCFERMIVVSDNACAEKYIAMFGAANINTFLYGHSFSRATTFVSNTAIHTSAADLEQFLIGLQNGTLINGTNRTMLLDKMSRQVYRQGIPRGSQGPVQDKVGFLWSYIHDAAIVHHPRGTYVAIILTQNQSYAAIADITRQLERIMYP